MTIFWQMLVSLLMGIAVGYLGVSIETWKDRRMMRRLDAQPWWPPMGTTMPTSIDMRHHVE